MDSFCKLKIFFGRRATIENYVFRLHYRVTAFILIALSIIAKATPLFTRPIMCSVRADMPLDVIEQVCFSHAPLTFSDDWDKKVGEEVPFPGVSTHRSLGEILYTYYHWVYFILLLQGIAFFLPGHFWYKMEGGKLKNLIAGLDSPFLSEDKITHKRNLIVEYLTVNLNNHKLYFLTHVFAEILNFVNVVAQLFIMNNFLGGTFLSSVAQVTDITEWGNVDRNDSLARIFPRVALCRYHAYGASGVPQRFDFVCALTMSCFNEKVFIFLYLWFVLLAVLSALALLYRAVTILYPQSRLMITRARARVVNQHCVESILNKCQYGDWFILDLLSRNLDLLNFRSVLHDLAPRLGTSEASNSNILLTEIVKMDNS